MRQGPVPEPGPAMLQEPAPEARHHLEPAQTTAAGQWQAEPLRGPAAAASWPRCCSWRCLCRFAGVSATPMQSHGTLAASHRLRRYNAWSSKVCEVACNPDPSYLGLPMRKDNFGVCIGGFSRIVDVLWSRQALLTRLRHQVLKRMSHSWRPCGCLHASLPRDVPQP